MGVGTSAGHRAGTVVAAIVLAMSVTAGGWSLSGTAYASPGRRPASALEPLVRSNRADRPRAKPKQCFYAVQCASSNPAVSIVIVSTGDTTSCRFRNTVAWGDGDKDTQPYVGGADGSTLATLRHTYADVPKLFVVKITGKTTAGSCFVATGRLEFTLMCPAAPASPKLSASATTPQWTGYVARTNPPGTDCGFTSVTGRWVQPTVTCPTTNLGDQEVDFWVGLDGLENDGSHTVEQTGVEVTCLWNSGTDTYIGPTYRAWYEMFPNLPIYTGSGYSALEPTPGSTITATVTYDGNAKQNPYALTLTVTSGDKTKSGTVHETCLNVNSQPCINTNAEWITEKVDGRGLASFAPWKLTAGYATTEANPANQSVAALHATAFDLKPKGSRTLAYACRLKGATFTVQQPAC
jgi:hypothetical protein